MSILRDALIVVVALVVLAGVIFALWLQHMVKTHGALVLIGRWHIGHPLRGKLPQDRGKWTRQEKARAAIRAAAELALLLTLLGLVVARTVTLIMLGIAAAVAILLTAAWIAEKIASFRHNRHYVLPLERTVTAMVGQAPETLQIERSGDEVQSVTIEWAPDAEIGAAQQQLALEAVTTRLRIENPSLASSNVKGRNRTLTFTATPPPPGYVSFADILPLAAAAAEHEVVLGLGPKNVPGVVSVDNDSPHIGLSMSSGDGKSVTARNAASQLAHHGALIAVLDAKLMSQHWAAGLRNVAYARTPAEIHELAIWMAGEVDRRNKVALHSADVEGKVHAKVGPRIIGILEEMNATQSVLSAYWKSIGGKGRSPAVLALDHVSNTGRQVDVNLFYIGQRLSAKAVSGGSGDARENLGVLLMSNPAASTWKMLVGDRHALPAATDVQGRLQVVTAKKVTEIQGAYVTGAQAREYAISGVVAVPRDDMPCVGGLAPVGTPERAAQDVPDMTAIEGQGPDLRIVPDSPRHPPLEPRLTIPEAIAEGISGPTYDAVRKALARARAEGREVPQPVGSRGNADEYDRVQWCDWEELRRQPKRRAVR